MSPTIINSTEAEIKKMIKIWLKIQKNDQHGHSQVMNLNREMQGKLCVQFSIIYKDYKLAIVFRFNHSHIANYSLNPTF